MTVLGLCDADWLFTEFDDIEISLASASNVSKNASPDSKDGSSGSSPGAEDAAPSGGDSDKENTPSKSSL